MVAPIRPVTDEQFDAYIRLPENVDKFELIGGEIAEAVSSNRSSGMAARFIR
jgi:hypothetical protein